jgi:hypothetical protein
MRYDEDFCTWRCVANCNHWNVVPWQDASVLEQQAKQDVDVVCCELCGCAYSATDLQGPSTKAPALNHKSKIVRLGAAVIGAASGIGLAIDSFVGSIRSH